MRGKDRKLDFFDVMRQKFVGKLNHIVYRYCVVGDELFVLKEFGAVFKRIYLPFSPKARKGDFLFYTTESHSIM